MPIEDAEEGTLGPVVALLSGRLHYVEDDGDPVLVVVSDDALVSISGISRDNPVLSYRALSLFEIR